MDELEEKRQGIKKDMAKLMFEKAKLEKAGGSTEEIEEVKDALKQLRQELFNCQMEIELLDMSERKR